MELSYEGIGQVAATFATQETEEAPLAIGHAVTLTAAETVGLGSAGGALCGVIAGLEKDQKAAVQVDGFATVAYTGSAAPAEASDVPAEAPDAPAEAAETDDAPEAPADRKEGD